MRRAAPVLVRTRHVSIPVPNNRATRWLYGSATARVVTTGEALREQLIRDNGIDAARIESVPTGIDAATFAPLSRDIARRELALPPGVPLVGVIATLRSWKGHRYLLDAIPLSRKSPASTSADIRARRAEAGDACAARTRDVATASNVTRWLGALDVFVPSYATKACTGAAAAMFAAIPCVTPTRAPFRRSRATPTARVTARRSGALAAAIDGTRRREGSLAMARRARPRRAALRPRPDADRMEQVFRTALVDAAQR
jgi:hypothetical protein